MTIRIPAIAVSLCLAVCLPCPGEKLIYHEVQVDASGRIVPWAGPPSKTYDKVVRAVWGFWRDMRKCPNGIPLYMQHQVWKADTDDPRGLGGDQIPMALSSWTLLYNYLGDDGLRGNMKYMADYWLDHGMTRSDALWGNLPFPYNLDLHSGKYDGDMRAGKGFVQPDKAASFAAELVVLYKMTGNQRYLDAATKIGDTLAKHIKPGDGEHSPWPYRVHFETGDLHKEKDKSGKEWASDYTTNYTGALRLFDDLVGIQHGNTTAFKKARTMVTDWLKSYPVKTNKWGPFFEDIPTSAFSNTEINADTMATYILEHGAAWDRDWRAQSKSILDWSYKTFANHEFDKWGVTAINEQTVYQVPGNSHTSRHASVELLYAEKTGDTSLKEDAIRRLNWATYMVDEDGKNRYPRDDNWLTDGYGDYVRHYLRAMASLPELAPEDQNHLLGTSSVVQSIDYGPDRITYTKYDSVSSERFKLGAWAPKSVSGGKMTWDAKTKVLTVKADAKTVTILR